jgi:5'-nucleotidase
MQKRIFLKLIVLSVLLLPVSLVAQDLVILHTNDTHSNIEPLSSGRNKGLGGYQRRADYISEVRRDHKNVLLLDAGDYNQGTPYFTLFKGDLEVKLNNAIGYEVTCLGNHEFDNGQQDLARRLSGAKYITLCANYDFSKSPLKKYVKPYTIINKGGYKVGIIGLLINLRGYVSESAQAGIEYKNPIPVADSLAHILRDRERCDLVICLTHLGYNDGTPDYPSDLDLAAATSDVDIIIGGHSHTFLEKPTMTANRDGKPVMVTTTGAYGVYVGRIDITFPKKK